MLARVTELAPRADGWHTPLVAALTTMDGFDAVTFSIGQQAETLLTVWSDDAAGARDELRAVPPGVRPVPTGPPAVMSQAAVNVPDRRQDVRGAVHRLVRVQMEASDVAAQSEYFREHVIPENLLCADGFRGVRFLVDAATGAGLVSTIWRDSKATAAVDALGAGRRERGVTRGISIGEPTYQQIAHHTWGRGI